MLAVDCGSGTYIRTLCHDLGQALGAPAHMRFLLRTRAGAFDLAQAVTLEELSQAAEKKCLPALLLPLDYPLTALPALRVPQNYARLARSGGKLPAGLLPALTEGARCRIYENKALLGVGRRSGQEIRFDVGLTGGESHE